MTVIGFIITLIVVILAVALAPIVKDVGASTISTTNMPSDDVDTLFIQFLPFIIVAAAAMGFFFWLMVVR